MDAYVYICACVLVLFPMAYVQWDLKFLKGLRWVQFDGGETSEWEFLLVVVTNDWDGEAM